ncbi:MAG: hypothetical protein K0S28_2089 [Paucimonas sp.]|jgi:DedD protein|nr:hypothetical protein [Paucimonas sp.]
MGLFSSLRKNKQEPASDNGEFYSRAESDGPPARGKARRTRRKGEDAADPILPEKKRARRRLIGALALVLAAIIGLPMILDSEPQPVAEDIQIRIPTKDAPTAQPVPALPAIAPAAVLDSSETASQVAPAAESAAEDTPPTHAGTADKSATVAPLAGTEPVPDARKPGADPKNEDNARALAILEGRYEQGNGATQTPADKAPGKYAVQVAALASKAKINELQTKLKRAGIASYTQTVATQSGERTRVRIGPFASREEAEKIQAKLLKSGMNGTIVPVK